jgi:hypothetical protein
MKTKNFQAKMVGYMKNIFTYARMTLHVKLLPGRSKDDPLYQKAHFFIFLLTNNTLILYD